MSQNYVSEDECLLAIEHHLLGDSDPLCRIAAQIAEGLCRKYHAHTNDVEDLVQEAAAYTLRHAHKFSPARKTAFGFVSMVCTTSLINSWRKNRLANRLVLHYAEHLAGHPVTRQAEVFDH